INLRLILVSGKTKEFLFSPNDSAADIAKHVYDDWPMDWEEEQVSSPNILRLIYQGRFLHGNVTLGGEKTPELQPPREKRLSACRHAHRNHSSLLLESSCCSHLFPEPQNRGTSVLWTSRLSWREGGRESREGTRKIRKKQGRLALE
ncbi:hypothetical protein XENORESO_000247, partial [Xenotaenia resolanae]